MVQRLRRLFRARAWDIAVTLLGLLSFSVYFIQQNKITFGTSPTGSEVQGPQRSSGLHRPSGARRKQGSKTAGRHPSPLQYLQQVELSLNRSRDYLHKTVVVAGEPGLIGRDLLPYKRVFQERGYDVRVRNPFNNSPGISGNWTILLCFSYGDGERSGCWEKEDLAHLKKGQLVSHIVGMRDILWRKDALCYTTNEVRRVPAFRRNPVSPPCWLLPSQFEEFLGVADALDSDVRWVFKTPTPGGDKQLLQPTRDSDFFKIKQYFTTRAIVQQYSPSPLIIDGHLVSIQLYALVTSISPLRAFLHPAGLVQYRFNSRQNFRKVPDEPFTLSRLLERLAVDHGPETDIIVWDRLQAVITKTLLIAERFVSSAPTNNSKNTFRCQSCFQLLSFDVILNSTLHPMVLEINGQPSLPLNHSLRHAIISDTISVLLADGSTYVQLFRDLKRLNFKVGFKGRNCQPHHQVCLTISDLEYLLVTRQQYQQRGGYHLVYPSPAGNEYSSVIRDLYKFPLQSFSQSDAYLDPQLSNGSPEHTSADMHYILTALEQIHLRNSHEPDESLLNYDIDDAVSKIIGEIVEEHIPQLPCSHDEATLPLLSAIYTDPPLNLTPAFDPEITDYYVNVPYDQHWAHVWGVAMSCGCEARAFNKFGPSGPTRVTLGVGVNQINLLTVDITHSVPWVISTYTLHVARQKRQGNSPPNEPQVCSLKQDCSLQFLEDVDCGLSSEPSVAWGDLINDQSLPYCQSPNASGRWLIPCKSCSAQESCFWSDSRWVPYLCRYRKLSFMEGQECLAGKKLLFIGDSTNRGIMYYIMQRINGTLEQWDKTHQLKSYSNLNRNRTSASFYYYPQFWLTAGDRPALDTAIREIIAHSQPVEDNSNTILVVGGVHWMANQHLKLVEQALKGEGLTNVRRVMKSLGAGFHQPVYGVHNLTIDQRSLFDHNQELSQYATSLGYQVLDTFNMTMARYTEFRPGTCSCHFHEVVEQGQYQADIQSHLNIEEEERQGNSASIDVFHKPISNDWAQPLSYRVLGKINAIYSEILLSTICGS